MESFSEFRNIHSNYNKNLWDILLEIRSNFAIVENEFFKIGIFKLKNLNDNKFYSVILRTNNSLGNCPFQDIIFFDVSEFLSMRKKIYDENLIKEKIMIKLAHEIKTPINSIIGLMNKFNENNNNELNNNEINNLIFFI